MDDAAKASAYLSAVTEVDALKRQVSELREQITALKTQQHRPMTEATVQADTPHLQVTEDLISSLLGPIVERLDRLEMKSDSSLKTSSTADISDYSGDEPVRARPKRKTKRTLEPTAFQTVDVPSKTAERNLSTAAANAVPQLGEDVLAWIHQTDFWFRTYKVHSDVAVPLIVSKLPAKDFSWVRYYVNSSKITTWEDIKKAFRKRYGIGEKFTAKQLMLAATQSQNEGCADFAFRKLQLAEECQYPTTEKDKCEVIIASLLPGVKRHYFDKEFTSLDALLESFLRYDRLIASHKPVEHAKPKKHFAAEAEPAFSVSSGRHSSRSVLPSGNQHTGAPQRTAMVPPRMTGKSTAPPESRTPPTPRSPRPPRTFRRSRSHREVQVLCLNCRKTGHFASRCPLPLTQDFLDWQQRFVSAATSEASGNEPLMPPTPAQRYQQ